MSENRSVISSVSVTSSDVKCPGCGTSIGVRFNPLTATLTCPFCGLSSKPATPQDGAVAKELDFNSALQRASVDWGRYKKIVVCSNCGGQTVYDAEQVTGACPFCGSTSVATAPEIEQVMAPNAVIPFSFSKEQAQNYFIDFVKKKRLVKKKVFDCKLENVIGIYLPYWTFDAFTASTYYGFYYDSGTTPYDLVTGTLYQNFDDILISATNNLRHPFISKVTNYDFEKAVPFSAGYLAGIPAVRYTLGLNDGWENSKKKIAEKLKKDVHSANRDLLVKGILTNYYNVKFRCLMAPLYLAQYRFGKKSFLVAINGQTGKTYCDVPTKIKRIILLGTLGIILGAALEFLLILLYAKYFG